ncbi:hypothetical protein EJ02DRAFT_511919 [Clathrospora elynae]|uniref:BTB domain-containing protein n=1 Tax=Clathrospora elynae TaxID=706981 RepID=A0A6A5SQ26_9PLEO|nr:hypothetical protein EJ02DRAFT_511919 [Clathrospora elynae]
MHLRGVGEERRKFLVHSKVITVTSQQFNALVNIEMTDELLDVEAEDFSRFFEHAYRREYTMPSGFSGILDPGGRKSGRFVSPSHAQDEEGAAEVAKAGENPCEPAHYLGHPQIPP